MGFKLTLQPDRNLLLVMAAALALRLYMWSRFPVDWNWDSYHHWQISLLSLRLGFQQGRLVDLNGCEYYWGMVSHLVGSALMALFGEGLLATRILNTLLGCLNSGLICAYFSRRNPDLGLASGLLYAFFPVAGVFDVLALQDTLALTLTLGSLSLMEERLFWSGLLLGLAAQTRTEYTLASMVIVAVYAIREGADTKHAPFLIGWGTVMLAFGLHLLQWTGNPLYPLYTSLYGIFSQRPDASGDSGFLSAMLGWIDWKLTVWPTKPTGIAILCCAAGAAVFYVSVVRRRISDYAAGLYFVTALAVFTPVFLTYLGKDEQSLLIMLRELNPIAALGIMSLAPLAAHLKTLGRYALILLAAVSLAAAPMAADKYTYFEQKMLTTFQIADKVADNYDGGRIVCDYPAMNYRFVTAWRVDPARLLGNLYSPSYRGSTDPRDYAAWLKEMNVGLWVRYDYRSDAIFTILKPASPGIFVFCSERDGIECYRINQNEVARFLG